MLTLGVATREQTVFRCLRKTGNEGAEVTCCSRAFHTRRQKTGKARSRPAERRVRRTIRVDETLSGSD